MMTLAGLLITLTDPTGLELTWNAPLSCPASVQMRSIIDRTIVTATPRSVTAHVEVTPSDEGYRLELRVVDGSSQLERTLTSTSCQEVSEAGALILAMTLDPRITSLATASTAGGPQGDALPDPSQDATPSATGPVPSVPPVTETAPAPDASEPTPRAFESTAAPKDPDPVPPSAKAPAIAKPRALRFVGRIEAGLGVGPLPTLGATVLIGLGIAGRWWRVEATGNYWPPVTGDDPIDVRAQLWSAGGRGCGEPIWRRLTFPICGGFEVGQMIAVGRGAEENLQAESLWAALVLEGGLAFWVHRNVGLSARLAGHATLRRPQFETLPSEDIIHLAGRAGLAVSGGVSFRL